MAKQPKQTRTIQFSLVPEFSWWKSKDDSRLMCAIEVRGRGVGNAYENTEVVIVEVGIMSKKPIPYQQFADQIKVGNLIQVSFFNTAPLVKTFTHRAALL
ncbi:hypothetical protein [Spirosoma litoris]